MTSWQEPNRPGLQGIEERTAVARSERPAAAAARRGGLWLLGLVVAAIVGLGFATQLRKRPAPAVETVAAERTEIERTITALGKIQPHQYVDVGAQVSGQLTQIRVQPGDHVSAGDLLAVIDPQLQRAKLEVDRAQIARLEAELEGEKITFEFASKRFQRQTDLEHAGATSRELVEQTEWDTRSSAAKVAALQARVQEVQSALQADQVELGYTRIYAPISGTVVSVDARQGQTLNSSTQAPVLLRIADLSKMTVWTQVSEADVTQLHRGMSLYATTLGYGARRWLGTLRQILPAPNRPPAGDPTAPANNNVVLYTALFDVDNPGGELRPEMSAQVFFVLAAKADAVVIPRSALGSDALHGGPSVQVIAPNRQPETRSVSTGIENRFYVEITSGLAPGEAVQKDHAARSF